MSLLFFSNLLYHRVIMLISYLNLTQSKNITISKFNGTIYLIRHIRFTSNEIQISLSFIALREFNVEILFSLQNL